MIYCISSRYGGGEQVKAFIPHPLPPNPPLDLSNVRQRLLERATLALGRLDSITLLLPDPDLVQICTRAFRLRQCSLRDSRQSTPLSIRLPHPARLQHIFPKTPARTNSGLPVKFRYPFDGKNVRRLLKRRQAVGRIKNGQMYHPPACCCQRIWGTGRENGHWHLFLFDGNLST